MAELSAIPLRPFVDDRRTLGRIALLTVSIALLAIISAGIGYIFAIYPQALSLVAIPFALLALTIIWALPHRFPPPVRSMVFAYFAVMLSVVLWPNYLAFDLLGLPWITLLRLFGIPMALLFLMCLSVSVEFRGQLKATLSAHPLIGKLLAGFVALQVVSLAFSATPFISFQKMILFQIYATAPILIGCVIFRKPGRVSLWVLLFTLSAVPLFLMAFPEKRMQHLLWLGHIPRFLSISDEAVANILSPKARSASGIYRVQATFSTPLGLAEYLALTTPFLIHYGIKGRQLVGRLFALACLPVSLTVIIMTDSRLGIVGFFLSLILYIFMWGAMRWGRQRTSLAGPAVTLAFPGILIVSLLSTFFVGRVSHLVWGNGAQQFSTDTRKEQLAKALPMIFDHPLGHGTARSGEVLQYYNGSGVLTVDSYFLTLGLDYGPIGLLLFIGLFAWAGYLCILGLLRARSPEEELLAPLGICFAVFLVIKSIFSQDGNHTLVFMMLGAAMALLARQAERRRLEQPK